MRTQAIPVSIATFVKARNSYMKIARSKANLVDFTMLLERATVKKVLEDSLIITPVQIFTEPPTIFLHASLLDLCTTGTTKSIDALVHGDIVIMHTADELDGHSSIFSKVLGNERCIRATIVAG